jgi:adenosylcobinamide-phosphate synthase
MNHAFHLSAPLIASALILDAFVGDPERLPHPTRLMGAAIARGERLLHSGDPRRDLRNGAILAAAIIALSAAAAWAAIAVCDRIDRSFGAVAAVAVAWTTLAARGLDDAAGEVQRALLARDEAAARLAIPALVGRDPHSLDREGMIRAAVESVAENASDGVIAPMLYLFAAGPVGAIAYKAINTLDSMIGHRDARYTCFGRFAARIDDAANWIPARLTAICIAAASEIWLRRGRQAIAIVRRDARRHESPNAGYPEAAMAGGLGVQLGGPAVYDRDTIVHPRIGDPVCPATIDDIASARIILRIATVIAFFAIAIARAVLT